MKTRNWFTAQRQDWIDETIRIFGYIRREHIQLKFKISGPQATKDLRQFQDDRPGVIEYSYLTKRYEAKRKKAT